MLTPGSIYEFGNIRSGDSTERMLERNKPEERV